MIGILSAIFLPAILGFLVISILPKAQSEASLYEIIALSYPVGTFLLTLQMFVTGVLRVPVTINYLLPIILFEIVILSFITIRQKKQKQHASHNTFTPPPSPAHIKMIRKLLITLLSIWLIFKTGSIITDTWLRPIFAWDSWTNWAARAKIIFYSGAVSMEEMIKNYTHTSTLKTFIAYPLHTPLLQVWFALLSGKFDEVLVKMWSPFYLLSMVAYLFFFTKKQSGSLFSLLLCVIFISSPLLSFHATDVYSDLALSSFIFFALTSFYNVLKGKYAFLPLTVIFTCAAVFTKEEGLFFALPLLTSFFLYLFRNSHRELPYKKLIPMLSPLILIIPWFIYKFSGGYIIGLSNTEYNYSLDFIFFFKMITKTIYRIVLLDNFNIIFLFFPILIVVSGRPSREFLYLLFPLLCYALFFICLYSFVPFYHEHLTAITSCYRNMLTYYPATFFLTTILLIKIKSSHSL